MQLTATPTQEFIPPGDASVSVSAKWHPFKTDVRQMTFPAGHSIAEIVAQTAPDRQWNPYINAFIGDWIVPRSLWPNVRPKPGTIVTLNAMPQGGGGSTDILRVVLLIALVAGSIALLSIPGLQVPVFAGLSLTWGALLSAGLSIVGAPCRHLLIDAIEPPEAR